MYLTQKPQILYGPLETPKELDNTIIKHMGFEDYFARVINFSLGFAGLISFIFILVGGFRILTSGGNEDSLQKGVKTVLYSFLGLVILTLSYAFVATLTSEFQTDAPIIGQGITFCIPFVTC